MLFPAIQTMIVNFGAHNQRGTANSTYFTGFDIGVGLGMLLGGIIADKTSLSTSLIVSSVLNLLAIIYYVKIEKRNEPISLDRFILVKAIPVGINVLLVCFSYGFLVAYAALYGREMGIQNVGLFFILMAIGVIASRLFTGRFIDKGFFNQIALISMALLTIGVGMLGVFQVS